MATNTEKKNKVGNGVGYIYIYIYIKSGNRCGILGRELKQLFTGYHVLHITANLVISSCFRKKTAKK